jgi:hypothetical protein
LTAGCGGTTITENTQPSATSPRSLVSASEPTLSVLTPSETPEDRKQAAQTGSDVILWQEVGDLAGRCAHTMAGDAWRVHAREPDAPLELANLETLVWFLESGDRLSGHERREFVGIDPVTEPVTAQHFDSLAQSYRAVLALAGLVERSVAILEGQGWEEVDEDEAPETDAQAPSNLEEEELDALDLLTVSTSITRDNTWWDQIGCAWFQFRPFDETVQARVDGPVIQVGITFRDADGPPPDPTWFEQLEQIEFRAVEHADASAVAELFRTGSVNLVSQAATPAEQARHLAEWVQASLEALAERSPRQT